jgi:hypothetical protein
MPKGVLCERGREEFIRRLLDRFPLLFAALLGDGLRLAGGAGGTPVPPPGCDSRKAVMSPILYRTVVPLIRRNGQPMFNRRSFCSIFTLHPRMAAYTCSSTLGFAHLLKPVAHGARRLTDGVRDPRPDVLGGFWGDPSGEGWVNLNLGPGAGVARQQRVFYWLCWK